MKLIKAILTTVLLFSLATAFGSYTEPKNSQHNNIYARLNVPSIQFIDSFRKKPLHPKHQNQTSSQTASSTTHPITNEINAHRQAQRLKEDRSQKQSRALIQYAKESFEITIILCAGLCLIGLSLLRRRR